MTKPTFPTLLRRGLFALAGAAALSLAVAAPVSADPGNGRGEPPQQDGRRGAIETVAHVLELTPEQMEAWRGILQTTHDAIRPLGEQVRAKEQALRDLVAGTSPDPAAIGALVLEIKGLREQIRTLEEGSTAAFLALLTEAQTAKIAEIDAAARLCRAVPAFAELHLIDPRD